MVIAKYADNAGIEFRARNVLTELNAIIYHTHSVFLLYNDSMISSTIILNIILCDLVYEI